MFGPHLRIHQSETHVSKKRCDEIKQGTQWRSEARTQESQGTCRQCDECVCVRAFVQPCFHPTIVKAHMVSLSVAKSLDIQSRSHMYQ